MEVFVYTSTYLKKYSTSDVESMVKMFRVNNKKHNITGKLLYYPNNNSVMQYAEGPKESLSQLLKNILCDKRHNNVSVIHRQDTNCRIFSDWDMALEYNPLPITRSPADDEDSAVFVILQNIFCLSRKVL